MRQRLLPAALALLMALPATRAYAYDFSAVAPTGQTLFFDIENGHATVVPERYSDTWYTTPPTGELIIPSIVMYNDAAYAVTHIGAYAFHGCDGLTSVTLPDTVTFIDYNAFLDCTSLTSVDLGCGLRSLGPGAFDGCSGLTQIYIPSSVTDISDVGPIFGGCYNLEQIVVAPGNEVYDSRDGCNAIIHTASQTLLNGCKNTVIPNGVRVIARLAFSWMRDLVQIDIPASVDSLGGEVFSGCSGLRQITVQPGNATFDSRNGCNAIIETATNRLVEGCQSTVIPADVVEIGYLAFCGRGNLAHIVIPSSVRSIGTMAFYGCAMLDTIVIPNNVEFVGGEAFSLCTGLEYAHVGDGTTMMEGMTFYGCTRLAEAYIGSGITRMTNTFYGCSGLRHLTCMATVPPEAEMAFADVPEDCLLTVPCGSKEAYRSASEWDVFQRVEEQNCGAIESADDASQVHIYAVDGRIMVAGIGAGADMRVYDMIGRRVSTDALPDGVYLVRIGDHAARRVVVVR